MEALPVYNAVTDVLDRQANGHFAAKAAYADPSRALTYGALRRETCRLANLLARLGAKRETRVVMLMQDTVDFPVVFLGAIRAGVVPVPVNTLLPAAQALYTLNDTRAPVLFISATLLPALLPLLAQAPALRHIVVSGAEAATPPQGVRLEQALAGEADTFETAATHPDETAFMLYSSGSTGRPKGVRHRHTSLMATAQTYGAQVLGLRECDVCLSAAKLFFAYGLGNSLTFPLSVGATAILVPERSTPAAMFAAMRAHQPTVFFGVPTLYGAMLAEPPAPDATASLRLCVSAGEALPEPIGAAWQARTGVETIDGVGSTELLHIFLSNRPGAVRYGASGEAVPGYALRLVDETGAPVKDGEIGELLVSGPSAADGYWNQRAKSIATFEGAWTRTGDRYYRDTDGRYVICGRSDDMFKVSGIWVSPLEVEAALLTHAAVLEAAVIAHDPGDGLLKPKAYVVLKGEALHAGLTLAMQEHVKTAIGPWKYPRWIEYLDALPKTATGKIQRFRLRERNSGAGT